MSVENTAIEGDFTVGRHITVGGDATVYGKTHHKGSLKVDGWFEAPNIIGVNKGLFTTATLLKEAYPTPQPGWYALVGESLPADVYVVEDGDWVLSGGTSDGNTSSNSEQFIELQERVTALESADKALETEMTTQKTDLLKEISALETEMTRVDGLMQDSISTLNTKVTTLGTDLEGKIDASDTQLTAAISENFETLDTSKQDKITWGDNIVASTFSDSTGKTTLVDVHPNVIKSINSRMSGVILQYASTANTPPDTIIDNTYSGSYGEVIYIISTKRFLCKVTKNSSGTDLSTPEYYSKWTGWENFGTESTDTDIRGIVPSQTALYYMGGHLQQFNGLIFSNIADNAYNSYVQAGGEQSSAEYLLRLAKFIDNQSSSVAGSEVMGLTEYGTFEQIMYSLMNNTVFIAAMKKALGLS